MKKEKKVRPLKAGIVCDNYKVVMFEKELKSAGFEYVKKPFSEGVTTIQVSIAQDEVDQIKQISFKVESHYKRGN